MTNVEMYVDKKNVKYEEWSCTGQDMTDKPYHNNDECVAVEVDSIANFRSSRDKREYNGNNEDEIESSKLYEDETETIRDLSNYDHNHTNKNFILYLQMVGWKLAMACMISLGMSVTGSKVPRFDNDTAHYVSPLAARYVTLLIDNNLYFMHLKLQTLFVKH
ncbi:hypothetical protein NQ318_012326 [Aromia moschata]|uniref:Uncharacterized protein n=1 Tax=Aromia moschata TaxID=1265417 RepID=A0AAV8YK14_9CUCU|nr:hypothetical protein NQ318_012326 [Aromia moschata]